MNEPLYAPEAVGRLNARTTLAIADFEAGETEHPLAVLDEDEIWAMISGGSVAQNPWGIHLVNPV
ncbi:hypothetical protein [Phaeovulum sp. NW3]|uniref:hypothetical protein n=1 Tax=Phaeovulum sp. NW3 TaxID=2934933 RepID=UPI0020200526|nr:hypothetical protein [Phaeovulum sp. NW3]MCL7466199.1 hypothetical protein [Phaeovulum sp. NW3]